jgi:hypothetical protein
VATQKPQAELKKLLAERNEMLRNEVFGGLSLEERLEYERKLNRINELQGEIEANEVAKSVSGSAQVEAESNKKVKERGKARGSTP